MTSDGVWRVEAVPLAVTEDLRTTILRAGADPAAVTWDGFDGPGAVTLAVFPGDVADLSAEAGAPVATVTVRPEACPWRPGQAGAWRLRGMATAAAFQGRGVGRVALDAAVRHVVSADGALLWCNARTRAVPFYRRAGFEAHGGEFDVPGIGPHVAMALVLPSSG